MCLPRPISHHVAGVRPLRGGSVSGHHPCSPETELARGQLHRRLSHGHGLPSPLALRLRTHAHAQPIQLIQQPPPPTHALPLSPLKRHKRSSLCSGTSRPGPPADGRLHARFRCKLGRNRCSSSSSIGSQRQQWHRTWIRGHWRSICQQRHRQQRVSQSGGRLVVEWVCASCTRRPFSPKRACHPRQLRQPHQPQHKRALQQPVPVSQLELCSWRLAQSFSTHADPRAGCISRAGGFKS